MSKVKDSCSSRLLRRPQVIHRKLGDVRDLEQDVFPKKALKDNRLGFQRLGWALVHIYLHAPLSIFLFPLALVSSVAPAHRSPPR